MKIEVKRISKEDLEKMGVFEWPVWTKERSEFDWFYSDRESCYILEGDADVFTDDGKTHFGKDDFVVFPKGLKCIWKINKTVKKHYNFG
jgi:uncharacterized protein